MSTSLDTHISAGSWDRFRTLLDEHRADCVHQREEALAECAQSVPDPVAQRTRQRVHRGLQPIGRALLPPTVHGVPLGQAESELDVLLDEQDRHACLAMEAGDGVLDL